MSRPRPALDRLCALHGIAAEYQDIFGNRHGVPEATKRALLASMGVAAADEAQAAAALAECEGRQWQQVVPPVQVVRRCELPASVPLHLAASQRHRRFRWTLTLEGGERRRGEFVADELHRAEKRRVRGTLFYSPRLPLPEDLPAGYHGFELSGHEGNDGASMLLVVAPDRCYEPPALAGGSRVWGPQVQLYGLRSERNWGMGDFTDLRRLVDLAAQSGAGVLGINPLHAPIPRDPDHASPYGPSSRCHWNTLYVDVEALPDFAECDKARALALDPEFQAGLRALRGAERVDYAGVAAAKGRVLDLLFDHFRSRHLAPHNERGQAFAAYCAEGGERLRLQALFDALQEHFHAADRSVRGWAMWPQAYQDPSSAAVAAFWRERMDRVRYYQYLQWQAEAQLARAGRRSWELGLGVGLYLDLAVGVDRGGADVWGEQSLYAADAAIGAPPDDFNLAGQDWGLAPQIPQRLHAAAYAPFIAMLRANMRQAGALRIDHVMGLMRQFWVPAGAAPAAGAYVCYPFRDLLGILALESQRNRCLVVGEDLGTVPEEVRRAMFALGILGCRPLYFTRNGEGGFCSPREYPVQAVVSVGTHDLPTLRGYWLGHDLELRDRLDLFPTPQAREAQVVNRAQDLARLLLALDREQLLPDGVGLQPVTAPDMTPELARAVHVLLARSPAKILLVGAEDLFGEIEQVNLPGTSSERYPNWRRKLPLNLEGWGKDPSVAALVEALRQARGSAVFPRAQFEAGQGPALQARVPLATYRIQLNRDFTLAQATELVPYWHELGISHVYTSPYLKARAGSNHGYDITDHGALNPEIGSAEILARFAEALHAFGMGQVIDVVPNHMGVMGGDNPWWLDVLENGQASPFAGYFDIDWEPLKEELRGKVLLPVLDDQYGRVLERGELRLAFDPARGEISLHYYQHRFPIDPGQYPLVLGQHLERLAARLGVDAPEALELQSLIAAFGHLPAHTECAPERIAERRRDKEIHKRRLAELCARCPDIALFLEENLAQLNGTPGEPESWDALHALIKFQAWRLAYWRVASDEINYRRFFDINDLAGLRMESEEVFAATHRLVLDWLRRGYADGLRIDHPDGLYDPDQYVRRLQRAAAEAGGAPYLVLEKILAEYERLPEGWQVHGTTGYRFVNVVNGLFVDGANERHLDRIYAAFIGERIDFDELVYRSKEQIIHAALASELNVLAGQLSRIALARRHTCDYTLNRLRDALTEIVACFPVYRTYITAERVSDDDRRYIEWAVAVAKKRSRAADVTVFDFVGEVLTGTIAAGRQPDYAQRVRAFAMKFQQFTGPVAAKGIEDTAFYIYNRLVSLNEVGGDPRSFGFPLSVFHGASQDRALRWPHTMLATSTHDTKRSEDLRARIDVLSELPVDWLRRLRRWSRLNRSKKRSVDGKPAPSRNDEYLLYQTLLGVWPAQDLDDAGLACLRQRVERYLLKAVREAKVMTSWINPDPDYEKALVDFIAALFATPARNPFLADFLPFQKRIARFGALNSLSQTLIKLASPGVPDIYQGNELFEFSLVDPDNRRPVDFALRKTLLDEMARAAAGNERAGWLEGLLQRLEDGRSKLYVIWRALALRRRVPDLFQGGLYVPLRARGARAEHVCAFARRSETHVSVIAAPRLCVRLLDNGEGLPLGEAVWGDTRLELPADLAGARLTNVLTDEPCAPEVGEGGLSLPVATLLQRFPVALVCDAAD